MGCAGILECHRFYRYADDIANVFFTLWEGALIASFLCFSFFFFLKLQLEDYFRLKFTVLGAEWLCLFVLFILTV